MRFSAEPSGHEDEIAALFEDSFTEAEGAEEGAKIGQLARDLLATTPPEDVAAFTAHQGCKIVGGAFLSRLRYAGDGRSVFVLGPVAVQPDHQRRGIGQALLRHALAALGARGVDVVLTYGDPAYYGRVGFVPISETFAAAPYPLQMPHGWQAQALHGKPLTALSGAVRCVPAFDNPAFW